jgi:hypothetical protein
LGIPLPSEPRYLNNVELKDPRPAQLDSDEPEEKWKPYAHATNSRFLLSIRDLLIERYYIDMLIIV